MKMTTQTSPKSPLQLIWSSQFIKMVSRLTAEYLGKWRQISSNCQMQCILLLWGERGRGEHSSLPQSMWIVVQSNWHCCISSSALKKQIQRLNSNIVENFNSLIAKMIWGKRVNFCQSRSYQNRCIGVPQQKTSNVQHNESKGRGEGAALVFSKRSSSYRKRNTGNSAVKADSHYGENAEKPDMEESEYLLRQQEILNSLQ